MKSGTGVMNEHNWLNLTTYLIIHHSITNIPNQTPEFICILGIVKETLSIPLLGQQLNSLENVFQFSINPCLSGVNLDLGRYEAYCFSSSLLISSLSLPPGTGLQSEAERVLILGTNDSAACLFALVC